MTRQLALQKRGLVTHSRFDSELRGDIIANLNRFVAIKVLPPERVADPERKRRFVQETRAASALNHPNIITIHDITQEGGVDLITMEYV